MLGKTEDLSEDIRMQNRLNVTHPYSIRLQITGMKSPSPGKNRQ